MSKTFDLSTLNLSAGTHEITVKARASGFADSPASNAVSYVVAGDEIAFAIYGTAYYTYYAKEGMTWGEWVESEYNTGGYVWNANGVICNADETQSVYDGERPMHRSFLITNGCAYSLGAYNGGSGGSN
jgi:hypothetical protein